MKDDYLALNSEHSVAYSKYPLTNDLEGEQDVFFDTMEEQVVLYEARRNRTKAIPGYNEKRG